MVGSMVDAEPRQFSRSLRCRTLVDYHEGFIDNEQILVHAHARAQISKTINWIGHIVKIGSMHLRIALLGQSSASIAA